jgi:N,N'-diacetylbacillosaminyl-diphospho-undecaprenol alpha-1,3-N-acetylgalactosaminyltransferase
MVIHLIHYPVSAKKFVEPLVKVLNSNGIQAELWLENREDLKDFIDAIDCPKSFAEFDLSTNPFSVLVKLIRLTKKFITLKPQAIHAHQTRAAFIPLLASLIARVPIRIYHSHGAPYLGYRGFLRVMLWLLEFLNCCLATHVIVVSPSILKKMVQDHIVLESKCEILGKGSICGIDLIEFSINHFDEHHKIKSRQLQGIAQDAYVILYVGRPFKRKGFHDLLNIWRLLGTSVNRDVLLIAGCNEKDVINAIGISINNVTALGYVKDLRPIYAACDVVVLPSHQEGFGYTLLEGAAAAKPLIGSDIPGIDSIIMNNKNGLLVPVGYAGALAQAIIALKGDPGLRKQMGSAGRKYVENDFDRNVVCKYLIDFYDKIGIKN